MIIIIIDVVSAHTHTLRLYPLYRPCVLRTVVCARTPATEYDTTRPEDAPARPRQPQVGCIWPGRRSTRRRRLPRTTARGYQVTTTPTPTTTATVSLTLSGLHTATAVRYTARRYPGTTRL